MSKSPSSSPAFPVREFFARFPDEAACLDHIMTVRFGGTTMFCEACGVEGAFHKLRDRRVYACPNCLHQIAPTANTILHDTRTPLVSWFYAMFLFATTRHGVSGKELQRQLGVTYKTAYRIGMKVRELMGDGYIHGAVKHAAKEWSRYDYRQGVTHSTNSVEAFWRLFKASVRSTHIQISGKHMQRYLDEFTFRANHRERVNAMFDLMVGAL